MIVRSLGSIFFTLIGVAAIAGCPNGPVAPENPTDPDGGAPPIALVEAGAGDCASACANLSALGCPEGNPSGGKSCAETCEHTQSTHLTDLKPACLSAARTVADARACGSVACAKP